MSPPRGTEQFDHGDSFGKNYIVVELAIVAIGVPIYFLTVFTVGGADGADDLDSGDATAAVPAAGEGAAALPAANEGAAALPAASEGAERKAAELFLKFYRSYEHL